MSGPPREDEDRRGFLDAPRWMDGGVAMLAAPGFVIVGTLAAVGVPVTAIFVATGTASTSLLWTTAALAALAVLCFLGYRSAEGRMTVDDAPRGVDPARHFRVSLLATGGWLSRYLSPTVDAHLVLGDDEFHLRYRRPRNEFLLAAMVLHFSGVIRRFLPDIPESLLLAGNIVLFGLYFWSHGIRYDRRYPWSRVHSVAAAIEKFHLKVDDEEFPAGFLIGVRAKDQKTVAALLRGKTLFHEEIAAP